MPATASRPEPTGRAPADALPVDVDTIRATVARALAPGPAPEHEDLVELEGLLRGHVQLLLPIAEKAIDQLWRGSVDWYSKRSWLDIARDRAKKDLGHGPAAHTHVRLLAHDCRALLRYAEGDGPR